MPLPTWTYSQLLDDGWDAKVSIITSNICEEYTNFVLSLFQIGNTVLTHRQPNPDEARIQAMSVIAACAKGLMYFQSEVR